MRQSLPNPFYYLDNFQGVLAWVGAHHADLLDTSEQRFIEEFSGLPQPSRALLVRMVMRKGDLFRASKLRYQEIGCPRQAAVPLIERGWLDDAPALDLLQLFGLLRKAELALVFGQVDSAQNLRKEELLQRLLAEHDQTQPLHRWCSALDEAVFQVRIGPVCERLRLMFFGNIHQDWSEFVLADLGILRYEQVAFSPSSRAFQRREEIDAYLHLHRCRERFEAGESLDAVLADVPQTPYPNAWLESRRGKLLMRLALQYEREQDWSQALRLHAANRYPGARQRTIRVLERCGQAEAALELALLAEAAPENELEAQQVERMLPRLRRALGQPRGPRRSSASIERIDLVLPPPVGGLSVEYAVREHLDSPGAPVHYVENALLNSLFGLLCWEALFAAVPGAFFHPFHAAPADLAQPDFHSRRAALFERCLGTLDDESYRDCIRRTFREKAGVHTAFVAWNLLDDGLLEQALACIPPAHLKTIFTRILRDVPSNRTGLPDLIQFWPEQGRYRMIEVKGPGDRLQDNQLRWLDHAAEHGLPIAVCYVQWAEPTP